MPKIILSELTSYAPGEGAGSSVLRVAAPRFGSLTAISLYGTGYSEASDYGAVKHYSSIPDTDGIALESDAMVSTKTGSGKLTLGDAAEPKDGTMFFLVTPGHEQAVGTGSYSWVFLSGDDAGTARMSLSIRYRGEGGRNDEPFIRCGVPGGFISKNASFTALPTPGGGSPASALRLNEKFLLAVMKDQANDAVSVVSIQGRFGLTESSLADAGITPSGVSTIQFGAAADSPEVKLHAAGYYEGEILTNAELKELYLALAATADSAASAN